MAASNHQAKRHSSGRFSNMKKGDDWSSQGSISPEIYSRENFEKDIGALSLEDPHDSGYFSNENLESDKAAVTVDERLKYLWSTDSIYGDYYSSDIAASTKSNDGSTYEGEKNKSTTTRPRAISSCSTLKSSKRARLFDFDDDPSLPEDSVSGEEMFGPSPQLQTWDQTHERHEYIAYRLEKPAKKRRTASARP